MNSLLARYLWFYPITTLKGELIAGHLARARKFQFFSKEQIKDYQLAALKRLLEHAARSSAYYRACFEEQGVNPGDLNSLDGLSAIPCLDKQGVIRHAGSIRSSQKFLFSSHKTTGGSTGEPVTIIKNSDALARERAVTARAYEWAGVRLGDPQARFWGVPLENNRKLKRRLMDMALNRRVFSSFSVDETSFKSYYSSLQAFSPVYLYGYASSIYEFSRYFRDRGMPPPVRPRAIITTSEVLGVEERAMLEDYYQAKVHVEYGCGEVGSVAHECEHGSMHVMDDNLLLEFIDVEGEPDKKELVVTDLFNYAFPLVRYKVGDFASRDERDCPCGRKLTVISKIHGRAYDHIVSPEGKSFHPEFIMYIFQDLKEAFPELLQFQVVQTGINDIEVNIVLQDGQSANKKLETAVNDAIHLKLSGAMTVTFNYVERIARERSGKMRVIRSLLNQPTGSLTS